MKTEEEFQEFIRQMEKQQLKRARSTSIVLGLAAIIAILFMIYGFTQSIEAQRQRDLATMTVEKSNQEVTLLKAQLAKCESEKKSK